MRSATISAPAPAGGSASRSSSPAVPSRGSVRRARVREDDGELLAAVAGAEVHAAARHGEEDLPHLAERLVADLVPELVVEHLEVVQVEHQQRERGAVAVGPAALLPQPLLEVAVVVEAGETVADGLLLGAPVQALVLERRRRQVGEHLQRLALARREAAAPLGLHHQHALDPVLDGQRDGQSGAFGGDGLRGLAAGERLLRELAGHSAPGTARRPREGRRRRAATRRRGDVAGEEPSGALLQRRHDGAPVEGRGEAAADVEELEQPLALLPLQAEEARVVDGRAAGLGQRLEQLQLVRGEAALFFRRRQAQDALGGSTRPQRQAEAGLLSPFLHGPAPVVGEPGV